MLGIDKKAEGLPDGSGNPFSVMPTNLLAFGGR
jgi:hypothetical protein